MTEAIQTVSPGGGTKPTLSRLIKLGLSLLPWAIIAGLLWAGIFIKPQPVGSTVEPPVIERGDAFFGIAAPEAKQIWVAGNNGKIIHSADGGLSWAKQKLTATAHLQDIAAWDAQHIVAVGNGGMVIVTEDGGAHWREQRLDFLPATLDKLLRVKVLPEGQAWAVGEMGALIHSADHGKTWERRRGQQDTAFNDIAFIDAKQGWAVGEAGTMLRTVDGGRTWDAMPPLVRGSLMAIAFRDPQHGVAVGLEGIILVTRDAGKTWTQATAMRKGVAMKLHYYDIAWDAERGRWLAVGDQGAHAIADAEADAWEGGQLHPQEIGWHTRIVPAQGHFLVAGASIGEWAGTDGSWRIYRAGK